MPMIQLTLPLTVCVTVEVDTDQTSQAQAEAAIEAGIRQAVSETVLANIYTVETEVLKEAPATI